MSDQSRAGRLQVYLVLAALSSRDLALQTGLKEFKPLRDGRITMFEEGFDFDRFTKRAKQALQKAGFTRTVIDGIDWTVFKDKQVWDALKTLNDNVQLLPESYTGTDCCISVLVKQAVRLEGNLNSKVRHKRLSNLKRGR